jgi:hypothetical protein
LICSASSTLLDWREHADPGTVLGHRRRQQIAIETAHVREHVGDRVRSRDVEERQHVAEVQIQVDRARRAGRAAASTRRG